MTKELPPIEAIFGDQGGAAILRLGEHLGKEIQKVNKTQVRKLLTELKGMKQDEEFPLKINRFCWVCRYIVAQEKSREFELLGNYLIAAAKKVAEMDAKKHFGRLQNLMESVYAHYLYRKEKEEERSNA